MDVRNYFLKFVYALSLLILKIKFGVVSKKMQCLFAKMESKGRQVGLERRHYFRHGSVRACFTPTEF